MHATSRWALAILVAPAALLTLSPVAVAAPVAAGKSVTFGIGPANATKLDGRSYLSFLSSPGANASDHVAVENFGLKPLRISVYTVDASSNSDGSIGFAPRSAKPVEGGSWLSLGGRAARGSIVVPGRTAVVVPVSVKVPDNAEPGDHAAAVIASITARVTGNKNTQPTFEQRVALRAYFRVSGPLRAALSIENLSTSYSGTLNPFGSGTTTMGYDVVNTGNVRLAATQQVDVSGVLDRSAADPEAPAVPVLLPGARAHFTVSVQGVLPQILMTAHVRLHPMVVTGDVDPKLPTEYSTTVRFWAVPWTLLAVVLLLVVAGVLLVRRVRRPTAARHGTKSLETVNA